jgi:DNA (cytosine-5)-methyltransferase 1
MVSFHSDLEKITDLRLVSGAGGATCGAKRAGLKIMYGMDADTKTRLSETWTEAFPDSKFYHELAEDFLERKDRHQRLKIDIIHMSPPCPAFSLAQTKPGPNNEKNRAALTCVSKLLKRTDPRVAILEQTFGLSRMEEHKPNFHSLLQSFTALGFSISWQTLRFQDHGIPQMGERLVTIASW